MCKAGEFACLISEQCIPINKRCDGITECQDETDERDCEGKINKSKIKKN